MPPCSTCPQLKAGRQGQGGSRENSLASPGASLSRSLCSAVEPSAAGGGRSSPTGTRWLPLLTEVTDQATELLGVVAVELLPRRVGVEQASDDLGQDDTGGGGGEEEQ